MGKNKEKEMQAKKEEGKKEKKAVVKKPMLAKRKDIGADARYIVRIVNKDLDGTKTIKMALTDMKGIGIRTADMLAKVFEKETGIKKEEYLGKIPEDKDKVLEEIVLNPAKYGLPEWTLNRRNDVETGESKHLVMGDLDFTKRNDYQRLSEVKSYRGIRLSLGLTVRGQRTKSTHRGKGGTVGVLKKDAKK
ncbi:MAG: 30S ribosomal protein S13 [Candidatus Diapherotrites archaeon]|nr:30S ribosomal protein S13 [Candidatus Diapherotrites archaeon]